MTDNRRLTAFFKDLASKEPLGVVPPVAPVTSNQTASAVPGVLTTVFDDCLRLLTAVCA